MVTPLATVVIPNYNGQRFLPGLMESLHRQTDDRLTILVVDDASPDESVAYLCDTWPGVRILRNERNLGFAGTCNRGLRESTTEYVVLLNNDTHVAQDWLAAALAAFTAPEIAAVASLVLLAEPPHLIDSAGDVYSVAGGATKRHHLRDKADAAALSREIFSACGASAFYRRKALARIGWLDETFESYYDDVDLGFRLAHAGFRCVFEPNSICYHHLSASYNPTGWRYHFNSARNAELVWWSHMPRRLIWRYLPAHACFLALQAANKLRQGCLRPYLAGKLDFLRRLDHVKQKREQNAKARTGQSVDNARDIETRLIRNWWNLHVGSRFDASAAQGDSSS